MKSVPVVYYGNGKIFTGQDEVTFVSAMGVKEGKVVWTGETSELTQGYIDLEGKTVIPGIIDAHMHPVYIASVQNQTACMPPFVHSIDELVQALKEAAVESDPDAWIEGWGYDESKLAEGRAPTREDLDRVSTTQPVQVMRSCFHARVVNSRALEIAGIDKATQDIPGGVIERDDQGVPTGVLHEAAHWHVEKYKPTETRENRLQSIADLTERFGSLGITGVTEVMGTPEDFEMYADARDRGFKQRIAIYKKYTDLVTSGRKDIPLAESADERVRFHGVKYFLDGSISGHSAYMKKPYPGTEDHGMPLGSIDEMQEMYAYAKERGLQILIHAMGDAAIQLIIDFFKDKPRWIDGAPSVRIEHCSVLSDEMIRQIGEAGIGATMNVDFLFAEYDSWRKNLDDERFNQATPLRSAYDRIPYLALASDSPATLWAVPEDPFMSIKAAVTRKAYGGEDINREERITVPQALMLYTHRAAEVCNLPLAGQLVPGYHADFAVLDRDLFSIDPDEIDNVKVLATYIAGVPVFEKETETSER